jgi:hypothetical protein
VSTASRMTDIAPYLVQLCVNERGPYLLFAQRKPDGTEVIRHC